FDKAELCILVDIVQIPEVITRERTHATPMEALCVALFCTSYPFLYVGQHLVADFERKNG
ncbi:hypothetical protein F442_22658, partial [Phytophthora nicotianae P10297]